MLYHVIGLYYPNCKNCCYVIKGIFVVCHMRGLNGLSVAWSLSIGNFLPMLIMESCNWEDTLMNKQKQRKNELQIFRC